MIFVKEKDIDKIPKLIGMVNLERENKMREAGLNFYKSYINFIFGYCIEYIFTTSNSYHLLTPWYNLDKTKQNRYDELMFCLDENIKNPLIKDIVLFYELLPGEEIDSSIMMKSKVKIVPCSVESKRRISFNQMVTWANNNFPLKKVIISNNDIYYDDSLSRLRCVNLQTNLVALTRTNYYNYVNQGKVWEPHSGSQDSWIFQTPLKD